MKTIKSKLDTRMFMFPSRNPFHLSLSYNRQFDRSPFDYDFDFDFDWATTPAGVRIVQLTELSEIFRDEGVANIRTAIQFFKNGGRF